jgi:regulator of nucleoside diphosphate kinase
MIAHEKCTEPQMRRRLKHDLLISRYDKKRIMHLLRSGDVSSEAREELDDLTWEIQRAAEVRPQEVPPDVVTMNSSVRISDLDTSKSEVLTIVFPADANYDEGKVSILAPLGTALLGYRVGDVVYWHVPRGVRQLRIDEILYQPEAAGHYYL